MTCNYGWTSDLENQMENVVGWPCYWRRIEPLTEGGVIVLRAWGPQVSSGLERIRRRDPFLWPQRGSRLRSHQTPPAPGSCSGVSGRRPSHEPPSGGVGCRREPTFGVSATPRCCPRVLTFLTRGVQGFWHSPRRTSDLGCGPALQYAERATPSRGGSGCSGYSVPSASQSLP